MKNIAIISPGKNAYSETFIKAHKELIRGNISFYHSGVPPLKLDEKGFIKTSFLKELRLKYQVRINNDLNILYKGRLEQSFKKEKIDIVLAEYGTTAVGILSVCKKLNIPLITHFHGADASVKDVLDENEQNYKDVFEYSKGIIAVSQVMKQTLLDLGASKAKIIVNPCGPNDVFYNIKPAFKNKKFFALGRFVDKKAPYYTILAFKEVLKIHPDAELHLAGNGPLLNTSVNLAKILGIESSVFFLDVITPEQVVKEFESSIAFIQHSITAINGDMEGTPVGVLEASLAGLPVISTNHAGIPDVIITEQTGLLVNEHDVDGMAKNMIRVLDDINFARQLGENGKKRVRDNFSMEEHISKIEGLIYG